MVEYVAKHDLTQAEDKQAVVLDDRLAEALYSKSNSVGNSVPKKEINEKWRAKLKPFYAITVDGETTIHKGEVPPVQVVCEQRQGKKHVTRVAGLETFGVNLSELASEFSKLFAASSVVQQLPGKNAGEEVLIQGNVISGCVDHLTMKLNIPKKYIQILDKSTKKK